MNWELMEMSRPLTQREIIIQELAERKRPLTKLREFAKYFLEVTPALHHKLICDTIDRLLDDEFDDLVVNTPPGSAKSTYASIALPGYYMAKNPKNTIITASHGFELAEKWGKKVRNVVGSSKFFDCSGVKLSQDTRAASQWATTTGGEFFGVGVGGGVLGRRGDLIVIDDPIKGWEEANSLSRLQKIHEWYETDLMSRLKPGGKIVLICQRLSVNDLAGYIIKRHQENPTRRLHVLSLPMECELPIDELLRSKGDRLWPEWYTPEMVADYKRDEFIWKTMYQQQPPSDDGSWANHDDIKFRPTPDLKSVTLYGLTDIALSVNSGDYTVNAVVGVSTDGSWDIVEMNRDRVDPDQSSKNLVEMSGVYKPVEWLIDDDNASKVFMQLVASEARSTGTGVNWKPMPLRGQDKETRGAALRGQFKRGMIYMPEDAPFRKWLTKEIIGFPNLTGQGVDDGIDTLSLLGRRLSAISKPSVPVKTTPYKTVQEMCLDELWTSQPAKPVERI